MSGEATPLAMRAEQLDMEKGCANQVAEQPRTHQAPALAEKQVPSSENLPVSPARFLLPSPIHPYTRLFPSPFPRPLTHLSSREQDAVGERDAGGGLAAKGAERPLDLHGRGRALWRRRVCGESVCISDQQRTPSRGEVGIAFHTLSARRARGAVPAGALVPCPRTSTLPGAPQRSGGGGGALAPRVSRAFALSAGACPPVVFRRTGRLRLQSAPAERGRLPFRRLPTRRSPASPARFAFAVGLPQSPLPGPNGELAPCDSLGRPHRHRRPGCQAHPAARR